MSGARLRVLQVGKFFPPYRGGVETYVKSLCDELRHQVEIEVLVANTGPRTVREVVDGVPVTRVASFGGARSVPLTPRLPLELGRAAADVVHLHTPNPVAELAYLASPLARRTRLVVTWHADVVRQRWLGRLYRPVARRLLARADAICLATPRHLRTSALLLRYAAKCHVCTFGVDVARLGIDDHAAAAAVHDRYGGRPLVLAVGRLVYYKGFEVLIEAMRGLDATLLIVGDGPLRARLAARVERLGLAGRVHLLGEEPDLRPFFAACDVFVLASTHRSEAFGIVQLEAMALQKPVVSTRLGTGVDWVNVDGTTGLTVPPGDPAALRAAMARLLADPALRARLGANGRRRVEAYFTTRQAAEAVLGVYRQVTGTTEAPGSASEGGARHVA